MFDEPSQLEELEQTRRIQRESEVNSLRDEIDTLTEYLLILCRERGFRNTYDHKDIQTWYRKKVHSIALLKAKTLLKEEEKRHIKLREYERLKKELGIN